MQDQHEAENQQVNNPEPFLIIKNARKQALSKLSPRRKQSYQHPSKIKKHRKMTFEHYSPESGQSSSPSASLYVPQRKFKKHSMQHKQKAEIEELEQIQIEMPQQSDHEQKQIQQEQGQQQVNNIPFECPEWELDKQSPYLKTFYGIEQEVEEININM